MLIFFLIKTLFLWCFAIVFLGGLINFIYKRAKGKHRHLRFSDKLTFREFGGLILLLVLSVAMIILAIPYAADTYLYLTNSYPAEDAKVLKVLNYSRGIGRGSILIEDGYRTVFLINRKEVTMKAHWKLLEGATYRIQYLPRIKYVLSAW